MKIPKNAFLKYFFLIFIIFTGITAVIHAQVDEDELSNLPPVEFINYEGPHSVINTREEIRQIGVVLGREIFAREGALAPTLEAMSLEERRQYSYTLQTGAANRYFVIHSVSGPDGDKLDADIFGLGVDAGVDHIRNLRWIVQGYLQEAYGYSERDAALIAEFVTIYNAVYRGNWNYITGRYKTPVLDHLTSDRAGLSIRYDEWPGRTLMLIPLGHGILGPVDLSTITDRTVIEELRREEDQGVPQRQEMVELMEREADAAEQQAQVQREAIREEERQIADERQQVSDDLAAGIISEEDAQAMLDELDDREGDLDALRDETQRLENYSEQIFDDAQNQRESIAADQQNAINNSTASAVQETGILGITIEQTNPSRGRIVRFNPTTGAQIRISPMNTIHTRTVTFLGGRIFAIAGENVGSGAVRLVEINSNTLEMEKQGNDDIRPGSLLWVNGNDLYTITSDSGSYYIGRFDTNLNLLAKSTTRVHPDAGITIQQGQLLTQREDGSVLILNPGDLRNIY